MASIEHPKVEKLGGSYGEDATRVSHPAFAQISATRVTGSANLYGSDFSHQNFVGIRIKRSVLDRHLSTDWPHAKDELIEVHLSEAQWATFVSSLNMGDGVQCTLRRYNGQRIAELPAPQSRKEQARKEFDAGLDELAAKIRSIAAELDGPLGKRKADELKRALEILSGNLVADTEFVAQRFDEHMEETVEKAKIEVNAYVTNAVMRSGIEALKAGALNRPGDQDSARGMLEVHDEASLPDEDENQDDESCRRNVPRG